MSARLQRKTAIITGGASGFGLGIVKKFHNEGANVVITDLAEDKGRQVAKDLGKRALFVRADVCKKEDWVALLKTTVDTFGALDVVVNNAGATYSNKPSIEVTESEFDITFNVNIRSIYLSCCAIIPYMLEMKRKGACFIQISSTAAIRPRPGLTWYNASKAACSNATKTLAVEYGPAQIRFNAVCPVIGSTGMTHLFLGKPDTPENVASFKSTIPMGRTCTPADVANACCYLASDEAEFITGVELEVDGGRCV